MKPKLVLHVCCGPDEAWVVHALRDRYELSCFFCNPNIAPIAEYELRLGVAIRAAHYFGVPFVADEYLPASWEAAIDGVDATPEGGERCRRCFLLRLRRTAQFCAANGFPEFTTVMSVSPHKRVSLINECGNQAAKEAGVQFAAFDFKKNDGFRKSIILSKELGLYRQDYCGCRLSKGERDQRVAMRQAAQPVIFTS
jgi:predicted adenine nucleotide alpha hydrolase (AANH) superfamily ATPase